MHSEPFCYFAYGSNLLSRRLQERVPSAQAMTRGVLPGYQLQFNKLGLDGSGKATLYQTGESRDQVHGVIYTLAPRDKPNLDRAESLGVGYEQRRVTLDTPLGSLSAFTYYGILLAPNLQPFCWYKALILAGAQQHDLPASYQQFLNRVPVTCDPNFERLHQHQQLLQIHHRAQAAFHPIDGASPQLSYNGLCQGIPLKHTLNAGPSPRVGHGIAAHQQPQP